MRKIWWKLLCVLLLGYTLVAGFLIEIPYLPKLKESIRNIFFHVPMWIVMQASFFFSLIYSILYLRSNESKHDVYASELVNNGLWFGCFGMITGMEWANIQWGAPWNNDPKQIGAGLTLLIYFAYTILRNSIPQPDKKARIAAVYSVFSFALIIPLLYLIPAHFASLHPGSDNDPLGALKSQDTKLKYVTIPAILGWLLLGLWISELRIRIRKIKSPELFSA